MVKALIQVVQGTHHHLQAIQGHADEAEAEHKDIDLKNKCKESCWDENGWGNGQPLNGYMVPKPERFLTIASGWDKHLTEIHACDLHTPPSC